MEAENVMLLIMGGFTLLIVGYFIYQKIFSRYIRPFLYYKLVVFDKDDEFVFYKKKKDCIIVDDMKGYYLFNEKDEKDNKKGFYNIPLTGDQTNVYSKRDDFGSVTFYFWRNNTNPMNINASDSITINNNASVLYKTMKTNVFNSALLGEVTKKGLTKGQIILIILVTVGVIVLILFKDKLGINI